MADYSPLASRHTACIITLARPSPVSPMPQLSEQTGFLILVAGLACAILGYLWLVVRAFRTHAGWGLAALLLPPVGGAAFALSHARRVAGPIALLIAGILITASPIAINRFMPVKKEEIKNVTAGETDLTITGMAGYDYATLRDKTDLTVLQMANPDVTDAHVENLRGLGKLKRLDLSDTAVTDAAIPVLAALPALEDVKLARTKVSDAGVKRLLAEAKRLRAIDVRGTEVKSATLRDWKNADKDHRAYLK